LPKAIYSNITLSALDQSHKKSQIHQSPWGAPFHDSLEMMAPSRSQHSHVCLSKNKGVSLMERQQRVYLLFSDVSPV